MLGQFHIIEQDYLKVSHGHQIYYEVYGNPEGIPYLFVHGGPGAGFTERDKRFFDQKKFKVIFFDQRGASRSRPFCETKNNSTDLLVEDIICLLEHLNIPKVSILAGSWGTTLALVFAIRYPARIERMILRGVFLGSEDEINHFIGGGVKLFFPKEWDRFESLVPLENRNDIAGYYFTNMCKGEKAFADKLAYEWVRYELSVFKRNLDQDKIDILISGFPYQSFALLESLYLANKCFLPCNYIINNTSAIEDIPISIIHGRFDVICPPFYAYQLYKKLNNTTISFLDAGHSDSDPEIENEIFRQLIHQ